MVRAGPTLLVAAACGGEPEITVASPKEGAVLRVDRVPLLVRLPGGWEDRRARVELDGADVTDPVGIVRRRWSHGGGTDYIATLDLEDATPGAHRLEVLFTAQDGGVTRAAAELTLDPAPCALTLRVADRAGRPRNARIAVFDATGRRVNLWGEGTSDADPSGRDVTVNSAFAVGGAARLRLDPGRYTFVATAGLREDIDTRVVDLAGDATVDFVVDRVVETPGALTADLHVHTARSSDAYVSDRARFESLAAAGIDVVVVSDHNEVADPRPAVELLGLGDVPALVPGAEARVGRDKAAADGGKKRLSLGHVNAFPLTAAAPLPPQAPDSLVAMIEAWRARQAAAPYPGSGDRLVVQLNHPRGIQFEPFDDLKSVHALFDSMDLVGGRPLAEARAPWLKEAPSPAGTTPLSFDAIELVNRFSYEGWLQVRADWFALLEEGRFVTATGNSDSHSVEVEQVGLPVNLVYAPPPSPDLDVAAFVDAITGGRVVVSTGPIPALTVEGDGAAAGPGGMVAGRRIRVRATVDAAPWVPVHEVRLVLDGVVVAREPVPDGTAARRGEWEWEVEVDDDAWVLVEAGWPIDEPKRMVPGSYGKVAPGYVPFGFTNPVRIDHDGDGAWKRRPASVVRVR